MRVFYPQYAQYGRRAPLVRNRAIIQACEQVVAFWDGHSTGTAHAISVAKKLKVPVVVVK